MRVLLGAAAAAAAAALVAGQATDRPTFSVNVSAPRDTLSPLLFGLDLEFTRHDLWGGLSAELVANRAFAVQPPGTSWPRPWPAGFPPRWTGIGEPAIAAATHGVVCTLSPTAPLCGVQQTMVDGGFTGGMGFGSAIGVQAGWAYTLTVTAGADGGAPLPVAVELPGVAAGVVTIPPSPAGGVTSVTFNFTAPATVPNATLSVTVSGTAGALRLASVSLLPSAPGAAFAGIMRADVVAALKALNFTGPLRYPGGCFAPFWDWLGDLQPYPIRPVTLTPPGYCDAVSGGVNAYTDGFMDTGISIDEYMALVAETGVTPAITIPLQFGTPQEIASAAALVEYVNGAATTRYGGLRAARGRAAPYNVSIWYAGNEINMQQRYVDYPNVTTPVGPPSATDYAAMLAALVPALRAVDPGITILAVEGGAGWDGAWAAAPGVAGAVRATSFHGGYASSGAGGTPHTPADFTAQAKIPTTTFAAGILALRATLDSAGAAGVAISADEWGLGPPWTVEAFNVAHGMYGASLLGAVIGLAANASIAFSNYFEPINEGALAVSQFSVAPTPLGVVMPLYAAYGGAARLDVSAAGGAPAPGTADDVAFVAAVLPPSRGGGVLVTLANRNATAGYVQPVAVVGCGAGAAGPCGAGGAAAATVLTASAAAPGGVFTVSTATVPISPSGIAAPVIPPYSIIQLVMPGA
jgi:alpha-L-arabinofuranosidase